MKKSELRKIIAGQCAAIQEAARITAELRGQKNLNEIEAISEARGATIKNLEQQLKKKDKLIKELEKELLHD